MECSCLLLTQENQAQGDNPPDPESMRRMIDELRTTVTALQTRADTADTALEEMRYVHYVATKVMQAAGEHKHSEATLGSFLVNFFPNLCFASFNTE